MIKTVTACAFVLILSGCAGMNGSKVQSPIDQKKDIVVDGLFAAAIQVRDEIKKMNVTSGKSSAPTAANFSGCSTSIVSIDFDGDLMLFVEDMQKANVCKIRMIGKKPKQDLVLSLHHKKVPLWQVLEDAGVQLGNLAAVSVSKNDVLVTFQGKAN